MSRIPTLVGTMGKLAQDARKGHLEVPGCWGGSFKLRSAAATKVLGTIPAYATLERVFTYAVTAHNGTSPTVTLGIYKEDGTEDDADGLVDNNDVDLTAAAETVTTVGDKWGLLATAPRLLVATFAASAAPTAGEIYISVAWRPRTHAEAETV